MRLITCFLGLFVLLSSCSAKTENNVSSEQTVKTISIQRFDKDLSKYLQNTTAENQRELATKYKDFLPAFGRVTINNSDSYKSEFYSRLQKYFSNQMLNEIYKDALETFSDVTKYETELSVADDIIMQNLNGRKLPQLYMHVSGFKENVMVLDGLISLSTDRYLGMDYKYYNRFFEPYQLIQMQPKMISRDYLKAWLLSEKILPESEKKTLLSEMINEGKILYTLSRLLPEWNAGDLIGYTTDQLSWCEENEKNTWTQIVSQNHLYENNYLIIQKYINEAPYTSTLTSNSPGRVGAWVGWQIVKAYADKNNPSLSELLGMDYQQILKNSSYNP